ncbi:MAG: anti-sigma factor [Myxococcales bacterium]
MSPLPVTEADLQAYVDGVLPESRRAEIDVYLASAPEEAERVRAYREQTRALKAQFNPVLDEQVPARLHEAAVAPRPSARARRGSRRLPRWSFERIAASVVLACAGAAAGWVGRGAIHPSSVASETPSASPLPAFERASLPREAAIAHAVFSPDLRRPVEVGAEQEGQLVAWLSKRMGSKIRPPALGPFGYDLIGGRLLPGAHGPVAQFMYQDPTGQRMTLYVSLENMANKDTVFRFAQEGPVNVFYWIDGKFGYALSAGIDRGRLARVATAVYEQLEPKGTSE